jgi:hypothetical protein
MEIWIFFVPAAQLGPGPPQSRGLLDHTQRRATVGRTPLDEWSARCRELCLTTHNTQNRQTSVTPVGFEPTLSTVERPQTYVLDRAATGIGENMNTLAKKNINFCNIMFWHAISWIDYPNAMMQAKWTEFWNTFLMLQCPICSYRFSHIFTLLNYYSLIYVGQQLSVNTKPIIY